MAINSRTGRRSTWEGQLQHLNPAKVRLIRSLPFTCPTCFAPGRNSVTLTCSLCNGTGYVGGIAGQSLDMAPYSKIYFMYADIQKGHGLLGGGGDSTRVLSDLGKLDIGDAMMFCPAESVDAITGLIFYPKVASTLVRPDRIIDIDGSSYNVTHQIDGKLGQELVFRQYILSTGNDGSA